jgi:hypothetical protein
MGGKKEGIAAALDAAGPGEPPSVQADQLALLPLPTSPDPDKSGDRAAVQAETGRRQAGRPPGSPNKRTEAWTRYLLANYSSPLEALAAAASMRTADLADRLGLADPDNVDKINLFKAQIAAAVQLAPYLHAKQPTAIDLGGEGGVRLTFNMPGASAAGGSGQDEDALIDITPADVRLDGALDPENEEDEENQEDSD